MSINLAKRTFQAGDSVNVTSTIKRNERSDPFHRNSGTARRNRECRTIIAGIKSALAQDRLDRLHGAARYLSNHLDQASEIVTQLSAATVQSSFYFRWFPGPGVQSGQLLIHNESIGLLINADPDSQPKGIVMTPDQDTPFSWLKAESALSLLSLQAKNHNAFASHLPKAPSHLRLCD